jgi:hypothetical protein
MGSIQKIRFYYLFSWWMFIWFIFYKLNIVKFGPSFSYIFAMIFNIIVTVYYISTTNIKKINYKVIFVKLLIWFIIDIIPLIRLYPYILNYKTLIVNLMVFCIYLLFMNMNISNILKIYLWHREQDNLSFDKYVEHLKYYFLIN